MECRICARRLTSRAAGGVCPTCRTRFGLPESLIGSRPRLPCARCHHGELIRCVARQRIAVHHLAPLAATYERKLKTRILTGQEDIEYEPLPDAEAPIAVFTAYVCRGCGFTEWYADRPDSIPIGPAYATELVAVDRPPYR